MAIGNFNLISNFNESITDREASGVGVRRADTPTCLQELVIGDEGVGKTAPTWLC